MAASCVRQHWVWRQSGPGTQTVKSATMRSEHRQDLKTLACMDLPCGPCTAPAAMPAASRLLARQPTILHDPSRPPGRRVVFKRGAQARSRPLWRASGRHTWWRWPWLAPCCWACAPQAVSCRRRRSAVSARSPPAGRPPCCSRCSSHRFSTPAALPAVYHGLLLMLGNSCGWAWTAVRTVPLPLHPVRAAMLNVTADYDQVCCG